MVFIRESLSANESWSCIGCGAPTEEGEMLCFACEQGVPPDEN
jgi:hypothetical protein